MKTKLILTILFIAIGAAAGYWMLKHQQPTDKDAQSEHAAQGHSGMGDPSKRPTPVFAGKVVQQDLAVWQSALGTVTPRNLVTVKSRIDGELMAIHFEEGQRVKKGQLLADIDPRNLQALLEQQQSQQFHDRALLNNAQLDLKRYQQLTTEDAIASQQVDTQAALVKQYQATIASDEAQINSTKLQLSYTKITAPISGKLGFRQVDPGNQIKASDANGLVTIAEITPITVIFSIPEGRLSALRQAMQQQAQLPIEAWDKNNQTRLAVGKLLTIDNQVDTTTGSIRLKAIFDNADEALYPNQFVNVRLQLSTLANALTVPQTAMLHGAQGDYVYAIDDESKVKVVTVKVIYSDANWAAVEAPLTPDTQVVTDGTDKLREGSLVKVVVKGEKTQ
jgi:multidrug efflux system membrane fusion protein